MTELELMGFTPDEIKDIQAFAIKTGLPVVSLARAIWNIKNAKTFHQNLAEQFKKDFPQGGITSSRTNKDGGEAIL